MTTEHNTELEALISLLDEPNNEIYYTIKDKILSYGVFAVPSLESAWENSFDHMIQQRVEELIQGIQFDDVKSKLRLWKEDSGNDLLEGFLLVTRYQYPDLEEDNIIRELGKITQDVWLELNNDLTGLEKVKVINHVLFDIHKFKGNKVNISAPDNYYLKNLLESKKGTPLSIGILYTIIARSLSIPVYGVDLPRHFVLAFIDTVYEEDEKNPNPEGDVLFYINPFNRGAVFTKNEIELYVKQLQVDKKGSYYAPCSHVTMIRRLVKELIKSYRSAGIEEKALKLSELLDVLN